MEKRKKAVIFDVDGTLANIDHRSHFVRNKPKNWGAFEKGIVDDAVNHDVVELLHMYYAAGYTIIVASGRHEGQRAGTEAWLDSKAGIPRGRFVGPYMRKAGDYRKDSIVKEELLDQMIADGYDPVIAVDDRDAVCEMWRRRGLRCFQCAPGNF